MIRFLCAMLAALALLVMFANVGHISAQQEAEDTAADVKAAQRAAKRQAREVRREQWLANEMKARGCLK